MSKDGFDWASHTQDLSKAAQSDADFYRIMAAELVRPDDALAVDFGCGAGGMAIALHETVRRAGSGTRVAGLDPHPEGYADAAAAHPDIRFRPASFEDPVDALRDAAGGAPDLIWAKGALHHADDEQAALNRLAAFLAPGGMLAVAEGGTTIAHLPRHLGVGDPGLQSRFDAAMGEHVRRKLADLSPMPYGWPVGLRHAGLIDVRTHNVLYDKPAPLTGADLDYVLNKYNSQFEPAQDFLSADDIAAWRRLLDPDDPAWLGHREDLFYLAAASVHIGHKSE